MDTDGCRCSLQFEQVSRQLAVESGFPSELAKQVARAVLNRPPPDEIPIEHISRHREKIHHVIEILAAGPAKLLNHHVLGRGDPRLARTLWNALTSPPGKTLQVMRVIPQPENLDLKTRRCVGDDVPNAAGEALEHHLPIELEFISKPMTELNQVECFKLDNEIGIVCRSGHTVKVAGESTDEHVGNFFVLQCVDQTSKGLLAAHRLPQGV